MIIQKQVSSNINLPVIKNVGNIMDAVGLCAPTKEIRDFSSFNMSRVSKLGPS